MLSLLVTHPADAQKLVSRKGGAEQQVLEIQNEDFIKVQQLFKQGRWAEGKPILNKLLKENPLDGDVRYQAGKYHNNFKNYDSARYELQKALILNKKDVDARALLMNVEIATNRYSSAICYINELLETTPYEKTLWLRKIELYNRQGNTAVANDHLHRLIQIYPEDRMLKQMFSDRESDQAIQAKNKGDVGKAIEISESLLKENMGDAATYVTLTNYYLQYGNTESALYTAERGLARFPTNRALIEKKLGILTQQKRFAEATEFIKVNRAKGATYLQGNYNELLIESARHQNQNDPYTLYGQVYEQQPGNQEALTYLINNSITKGYYDQALYYIGKAAGARGGSKDLRFKRYDVYRRMGNVSKANQELKELYFDFPQDADIKEAYITQQYQVARDLMAEERYPEVINATRFLTVNGDVETRQNALNMQYNAYLKTRNYNAAILTADQLLRLRPGNVEYFLKKAEVYMQQNNYPDAMGQFETAFESGGTAMQDSSFLSGYNEVATRYMKTLLDNNRPQVALQVAQRLFTYVPESNLGIHYAINSASLMRDSALFQQYAEMGNRLYPNELFFKIKYAEALSMRKDYVGAQQLLQSIMPEYPGSKELANAYSGVNDAIARQRLKDKDYDGALALVDTAINYDPLNKGLKYTKGEIFEAAKIYDSTYDYQKFYDPSALEVPEFRRHLDWLQYKTFKNSITASHFSGRFDDRDVITAVSTIEYSRNEKNITYTGRVNYSGRVQGAGVQPILELTKYFGKFSVRGNIGWSNRYFPQFLANISGFQAVGKNKGYEGELGLGYRRLQIQTADRNDVDSDLVYANLANIVGGLSKSGDLYWANTRLNLYSLDGTLLYNLMAQGRFYFLNHRSNVMATASAGSAPEVDIINTQLYQGFSTFNTMVGAGGQYMVNKYLTLGLTGNWYNYKANTKGVYRSLYTTYFTINVSF